MNAVEAVNSINEGITSTVRTVVKSAMSGRPYDSQFDQRLRNTILKALASHLAYVRAKAQKVADNNPEYYNAYAHGFDDCLAVIQSEIDELTK